MKQTTANIWTVVLLSLLFIGMVGLGAYAMWGGPKGEEEKEPSNGTVDGDNLPERS